MSGFFNVFKAYGKIPKNKNLAPELQKKSTFSSFS